MRIVKLTQKERENILENLLKRSPNQYSKFETTVRDILDKVKAEGDQALFAYTEQFDGVKITEETFRVTEEEIAEAYEKVDSHLIEIIRKALVNIRDYHQKQVRYSWFDSKPDGTLLGQKVTALERVGVYVPGGKAVYPSSVLMNIVPAKGAGVERIVMTTPPGKDGKVYPITLVAAKEAGVDEIYKVGGAQAIGALCICAWVFAAMSVLMLIMKYTIGIRVDHDAEIVGLDRSEHGYSGSFMPLLTDDSAAEKSKGELRTIAHEVEDEGYVSDYKVRSVVIITRENKLNDLKNALNEIGISGITVSSVMGCGVQKGHMESYYRGVEVEVELIPKVRVEVVISEVPLQSVIEVTKKVLKTGNVGDGKIFVYDVDNVIRIRTEEEGVAAL